MVSCLEIKLFMGLFYYAVSYTEVAYRRMRYDTITMIMSRMMVVAYFKVLRVS
jgi:hypothetical protein